MDLKAVIRWLKTSRWATPLLASINALLWLTDRLAVWSVGRVPIQPNTLGVLKLDVLGDYLFFRPYLRFLKEHPAYAGINVTLIGNAACRGIAEQFDADIVSDFLWVDIYKLASRPLYRFRFVRQLRRRGLASTFCPTYSRVLVLDDFLAYATGAPLRIAVRGDLAARKAWEARLGDLLFTKLIDAGDGIVFEMERNRRVLSGLLGESIPLLVPHFSLTKWPIIQLPHPYVVLSLGAGQAFRVWPAERFAAVAKHILSQYPNYHILLTGTPAEQTYTDALLKQIPTNGHLRDLTGKLSLIELIAVLKQAKLLIANETGTVHLAASVQTPTLVISQGRTLVRWHPYPATIGNMIQYLYPPFIEANRHRLQEIAADFNPESPFQVEDISIQQVLSRVDASLQSQ